GSAEACYVSMSRPFLCGYLSRPACRHSPWSKLKVHTGRGVSKPRNGRFAPSLATLLTAARDGSARTRGRRTHRMARLSDLLHESAVRYGDKPAFLRGDAATSYRELAARAASFGSSLRASGVQPGDRVALLFDGEVDYLVAYYGILCADRSEE